MNVREKLVELLRNSPHLDVIKGYKGNDCTFEQGADWLISHGVMVQELDGCDYCNVSVYVKTTQYLAPVLAPTTRTESLRQELLNLTGEVYLYVPKKFCPMCGRKLPQPPKGE